MDSTTNVRDVLDAIYQAPCRANGWLSALNVIGEATASLRTALYLGADDDLLKQLPAGQSNTLSHPPRACLSWQSPALEAQKCDARDRDVGEVCQSAIWEAGRKEPASLLCQSTGTDHVLVGTITEAHRSIAAITFYRQGIHRQFNCEDREFVRELLPHLTRAMRITRHISRTRPRFESASEVLGRLAAGVVLVGPDARVLHLNESARGMLEAADGLILDKEGRLSAMRPCDDRALKALVGSIRSDKSPCGQEGSRFLAVPRPSGKRPYGVHVKPARGSRDAGAELATVSARSVVISDPERVPRIDPVTLQQLYGVTLSEGRVAAELGQGLSAAEVAERLRISVKTVRVHTQAIFRKCGVHHQAALVRLLQASVPPFVG